MKIRTRLFFIMILVAAGFAGVLGSWMYSRSLIKPYRSLLVAGLQCSIGTRQLSYDLKALLDTTDLDFSINKLYTDFEAADAILMNFFNSKVLLEFAERRKVQDSLSILMGSWDITKVNFSELSTRIKENLGDMHTGRNGLLQMIYMNGTTEIFMVYSGVNSAGAMLTDSVVTNFDIIVKELEAEINQQEVRSDMVNAALVIPILLAVILLIARFSRGVTRRLVFIESDMKRVADRDFSGAVVVKGRDEIGVLEAYLNQTIEGLKNIFSGIKLSSRQSRLLNETITRMMNEFSSALEIIANLMNSSNEQFALQAAQIRTASGLLDEISRTTDRLGEEVSNQSSAVEESSASMEEIVRSIENVNMITQAQTESAANLIAASQTGEERMKEAQEAVNHTLESINAIQEIVGIINSIAESTNLLAMNAAIEAAHAGESGKGFSVVAEEIRKLAESTSENSRNIAQLVEEVSAGIVQASESSGRNADFFESVITEVNRFAAAFSEISRSLGEMAAGTDEVLTVTTTLTEITQHISSGFNEIHSGILEINHAMESVNNVSTAVVKDVTELNSGVENLRESLLEVANQQETSRISIESLDEEIEKFKT